MELVTSYDGLNGPEKAAILFLCLGEDRGSKLLKNLNEREIQKASRAMATLGVVASEVVELVLEEFRESVQAGGTIYGSFESAKRMLASFLPSDEVERILGGINGPVVGRSLWDNMSALSENVIANYLFAEHNQTISVVLSNLKPEMAAKILPLFPDDRVTDIVSRMVGLESVPQQVLDAIEDMLSLEFMASGTRHSGSDTSQRMADMFNKMDRSVFEEISVVLEKQSPEEFASIKQKMFTFEDLGRLDSISLGKVIAAMDGNTVPLALRGLSKSNGALLNKFFESVPRRARELLEDTMRDLGSVRAKDVQAAQGAMVDMTLKMARADEIMMPIDDNDEML